MTHKIDIVCATDNAYAMAQTVCLCSALYHLSPDYSLRIFVLDGGIHPETKKKMEESLNKPRVELLFIDIKKNAIRKYPVRNFHVNWITFSKLLVPAALPKFSTKAIWLDSDMVVCSDLSALWNIDMEGKQLLAVHEGYETSRISLGIPYWNELSLAPDEPYFNAGLLVFDLAQMRQQKFTERAMECLDQNQHRLQYNDQDVLNILLIHQWKKVDARWNYIPWGTEKGSLFREQKHPYIIHYAALPKPWHFSYGYFRMYGEYFYYALALTAWKGWRPNIPFKDWFASACPSLFKNFKKILRILPFFR